MKKFSNVASKIKQDLEKQNAAEDVRPHQGEETKIAGRPRLGSARGPVRAGNKVVFGRSYSNSGLNCAKVGVAAPAGKKVEVKLPLNKQALDKLNYKAPTKTEAHIEEALQNVENTNTANKALPPRTPNYGKTPKYLEKFKDEAKAKENARLEAKAAKNRPAGTRLLPEDERIQSLEALQKNKAEVTKILC